MEFLFGILLLGIPPIPTYLIASGWAGYGRLLKFGVYLIVVSILGYFIAVSLSQFFHAVGLLPEGRPPGERYIRSPSYKTGSSGALSNVIFSPLTFLIARYLIEHCKSRESHS